MTSETPRAAIGTRRIIVRWHSEQKHGTVPVAELLVGADQSWFQFGYIEGMRTARKMAFQPFAAFPEIDRRYVAEALFPFFRNRVLPTTRPDYLEYVAALGLTTDSANVADLLGRSAGRRHTDRIETVLAAERDTVTGRYFTHFLARGVRHVPEAETVLTEVAAGDELQTTRDTLNPVNPMARHLAFNGKHLGFVPNYLLTGLDDLDERGASIGSRWCASTLLPARLTTACWCGWMATGQRAFSRSPVRSSRRSRLAPSLSPLPAA